MYYLLVLRWLFLVKGGFSMGNITKIKEAAIGKGKIYTCNVCRKATGSGRHLKTVIGRVICICPSCLMWSEDPLAKLAREAIRKIKK